jgi:hypothetical protein
VPGRALTRTGVAAIAAATAVAIAACGDGGHDRAPPADTTAQAVAASARAIESSLPRPIDLASRQQLIVRVSAITRLGVVSEVRGPAVRIYALVPAGPRLRPAGDVAVAAGDDVCTAPAPTGHGVRLTAGSPDTEAFGACRQRLIESGSRADGRFLLQTETSPYVVVLYPYLEAFTASLHAVVEQGGLRAGVVPGRFGSDLQPGCGLQFYPATAALLGWCADDHGRHDPDSDPTVAALGRALAAPGTAIAVPAAVG